MTARHDFRAARRPLRAAVIVGGVSVLMSLALMVAGVDVAGAEGVEGGPDISHASAECIEILEKGGTAEECQQAPDPFLPPWQEMVWSTLAFAIVGFGVVKFGLPAVKKSLAARTDRIRGELDAAEQARIAAEAIHLEYRGKFFGAADEVEAIIASAREQAQRLRADMERTLAEDLAATRAKGFADIEQLRDQALLDVRFEAGQLVAGLTEHLVRANLDPATQSELVDDYISSLNRSSN
jgi:F-type H+-transporting ATPase subunit b